MKNLKQTSFLILLLAATLASCVQKSGTTKTIYTTVTNPSTTTGSGTGSTTSCSDGVARSGATRCYYKELPTFVFSGSGMQGPIYWSSATDLPSDFSKYNFVTDATFAVRIKPVIVDGGTSIQKRRCSQYTKNNFTKLQVKVMLGKESDNGLSSNIQTLTASVGSYSNTARFTVSRGTNAPYVMSIYSVLSNHRCNALYGSAPTGCPSAYYDIPVVVNTAYETECVGFELQFATDETYDLPN